MRLTTSVDEAANALCHGHLVGLPTETVYGLAGLATNEDAVRRIFEVKGRPADHPLIVHISDASAVDEWVSAKPDWLGPLLEACWPGPLTVVLGRADTVLDVVTGGRPTVALRAPEHPVAQDLLAKLRTRIHSGPVGIAAPSANRFGKVSPTTAADVLADLKDVTGLDDLVLDGGPSAIGLESTIVDATGANPRILRPGAIDAEVIAEVTDLEVTQPDGTVHAPGMLPAHYSPSARVVLVDSAAEAGTLLDERVGSGTPTGLIGLEVPEHPQGVVLGHPDSAAAYAHGLYRWLREADARGLGELIAVRPPARGIGLAIRDRLGRAAHDAQA